MSYSCADFVDSIVSALGVTIPLKSADSPSEQAGICCLEIANRDEAARAMLAALITPEKITPLRPLDDDNPDGYRESPRDFVLNNIDAAVWLLEHAPAAIAQAKAAGITTA